MENNLMFTISQLLINAIDAELQVIEESNLMNKAEKKAQLYIELDRMSTIILKKMEKINGSIHASAI